MKRWLLLLCLCIPATALHARDLTLDVMSFNIRCGSCEQPGDVNHWSRRRTLVADLIRRHEPDLIGLQEAELYQARDLIKLLGEYDWIGVGRDDGKEQGEATAILFRKSRFQLESGQTFWLSPTPSSVGKGWDAALNRTISVARLRERDSNRELFLFNTHFDHVGRQAKVESSKLVVELTRAIAGSHALILTGDFNYTRDFTGYLTIARQLRDAELVSMSPARGGSVSCTGFGRSIVAGNKIDFVFVSEHFDVISHEIITESRDGRYPSDHYPIKARVVLRDG
jgi:endonuclease/exonuclease/phosphatase family metal-dependent hydrolase